MSEEFIGAGWAFPVHTDQTGNVALVRGDREVQESIRLILGTAYGERPMRPDFGCAIHDLMFAPNSPATAGRAAYYCEEAIYKYEPRVEKVSVVASTNRDEPNRLDVHIEYVIAGRNDARNLVFPFYLRKPDEEGAP